MLLCYSFKAGLTNQSERPAGDHVLTMNSRSFVVAFAPRVAVAVQDPSVLTKCALLVWQICF